VRALALVVLGTLASGGCRAPAEQPPPATPEVAWHPLGSFSGRGSQQTGSFTSETGMLRIRWEATNPNGAPAFRLTAHSAISGRQLEQVVDQVGVRSGVGYVQQDPHVFYMVVESQGTTWTFTVDEAVEYSQALPARPVGDHR
jgi:hypothetical protein